MKKFKLAILVLTVGVLGLGLYGCAKSKPASAYHSYSYYKKHKAQAKAWCKKIAIYDLKNHVTPSLKTQKECAAIYK